MIAIHLILQILVYHRTKKSILEITHVIYIEVQAMMTSFASNYTR